MNSEASLTPMNSKCLVGDLLFKQSYEICELLVFVLRSYFCMIAD